LSGRKHFEVLDNGIKYELVKELKDLKVWWTNEEKL
jgi:hypothetical protein